MNLTAKSLGELQALVLPVLWDSATPLSVREVLAAVQRPGRVLAYTTVLTVLTRLYDQDLVLREKRGKAFYYRARVSREQWMGERAANELVSAGESPPSAVLAAFLDTAERSDPALLDRLSALIESRRRSRTK